MQPVLRKHLYYIKKFQGLQVSENDSCKIEASSKTRMSCYPSWCREEKAGFKQPPANNKMYLRASISWKSIITLQNVLQRNIYGLQQTSATLNKNQPKMTYFFL